MVCVGAPSLYYYLPLSHPFTLFLSVFSIMGVTNRICGRVALRALMAWTEHVAGEEQDGVETEGWHGRQDLGRFWKEGRASQACHGRTTRRLPPAAATRAHGTPPPFPISSFPGAGRKGTDISMAAFSPATMLQHFALAGAGLFVEGRPARKNMHMAFAFYF